jgi:hypothetical protein
VRDVILLPESANLTLSGTVTWADTSPTVDIMIDIKDWNSNVWAPVATTFTSAAGEYSVLVDIPDTYQIVVEHHSTPE